jgi:hypothetical protein
MPPTQEQVDQLEQELADLRKQRQDQDADRLVAALQAASKKKDKNVDLGVIPSKANEQQAQTGAGQSIALYDGAPQLSDEVRICITENHLLLPLIFFTPEYQHYALGHPHHLLPPSRGDKEWAKLKEKLGPWEALEHQLGFISFKSGFQLMLKATITLMVGEDQDEKTAVYSDGASFMMNDVEARVTTDSSWPVMREYALMKIHKWKNNIAKGVAWELNKLTGWDQNAFDTSLAIFGVQSSSLYTAPVNSLSGTGQSFLGALINLAVQEDSNSRLKINASSDQMRVIVAKELKGEQPVGELPVSIPYANRLFGGGGKIAPNVPKVPFVPRPNPSSFVPRPLVPPPPPPQIGHPTPTLNNNSHNRFNPYVPSPSPTPSSERSFRDGASPSPTPYFGSKCLACKNIGHTHVTCPDRRLNLNGDNLMAIEPDRGIRNICRNYNWKKCDRQDCPRAHCCSRCGRKGHRFEECTL